MAEAVERDNQSFHEWHANSIGHVGYALGSSQHVFALSKCYEKFFISADAANGLWLHILHIKVSQGSSLQILQQHLHRPSSGRTVWLVTIHGSKPASNLPHESDSIRQVNFEISLFAPSYSTKCQLDL